MSTAVPLPLPSEPHARSLCPEGARSLAEHLAPFGGGRTVEEIAEGLQVSVSLPEAVERGWITAAEQRLYEHRATREDLEALGCPPDEIDKILRGQ